MIGACASGVSALRSIPPTDRFPLLYLFEVHFFFSPFFRSTFFFLSLSCLVLSNQKMFTSYVHYTAALLSPCYLDCQ